ncbi:MAG: hypothetical protein ACPG77_14830 [Nannocystaceae bacterium]
MHKLRRKCIFVAALGLMHVNCAERLVADDVHNLDPDVGNIPPGDAVGNFANGLYDVESQVLRCTGACTYQDSFSPGDGEDEGTDNASATVCEVGSIYQSVLSVQQADGQVVIAVQETSLAFIGGIDSDGFYDAVGQTTQNDGAILNRTRVAGMLDDDGLEGAAVAHLTGSIGVDTIDCQISYDVTGSRSS